MIFTEPRFLLFFLVVFCVHWALPGARARKVWLLVCSYAFYAGWDYRFLSLIITSTLIDYCAGRMLGLAAGPPLGRRTWLLFSLCGNLGLLAFFKYYDFFVESAAAGLAYLGLPCPLPVLEILLPVGISFYTFQTLSYTIDIYRGTLRPTRDLLDFALFVGFFPQLVAGPIVRAVDFLPQLQVRHLLRDVHFRQCALLFFIGFVKKACVSDNVAPLVDTVFADPTAHDFLSNWLGIFLWHVQVYCDFSGYSDMAIASAGLLGYTIPINFDFPYFARNIGTFWRRWHISLSSWLKDYVYIPLGGNRVSPVRNVLNLQVTLVLCGLWHGAAWKFVLFGFMHAFYLGVIRWWGWWVPRENLVRRGVTFAGPVLMTFFLMMSWIVFRSVDFEGCAGMFGLVLGLREGGVGTIDQWWWILVAVLFAVHWTMYRGYIDRSLEKVPNWLFAFGLGLAIGFALPFASTGYSPFIYFQF